MQTRIGSIIESLLNIGSGMVIAYLITIYIGVGVLGITINSSQTIELTVIMTVVSILRSYLWRRYFNSRLRKRYDN
jgi:membrane protein implicated in regulation of membrane protease activity